MLPPSVGHPIGIVVVLLMVAFILNEISPPFERLWWSYRQLGKRVDKKPFLVFKDPTHYFCRCEGCSEPVKCHGLCSYHRRDKQRHGYAC